jgi:hypothetical protein
MSVSLEELRELTKAELRRAGAELDLAAAEMRRLYQKYFDAHGNPSKKKSGRPTIWRGKIGLRLVQEVEEFRARCERGPEDYGLTPEEYEQEYGVPAKYAGGRISLAQAIRRAIKTDPVLKKHSTILRLTDRALQARYQQAADCWSKARQETQDNELEAARKRWKVAISCVNALCDELEGLRTLD